MCSTRTDADTGRNEIWRINLEVFSFSRIQLVNNNSNNQRPGPVKLLALVEFESRHSLRVSDFKLASTFNFERSKVQLEGQGQGHTNKQIGVLAYENKDKTQLGDHASERMIKILMGFRTLGLFKK